MSRKPPVPTPHVVTVQLQYANPRCSCGAYMGSTQAPKPDSRMLWLHPPHPTCRNAGKLFQPPVWQMEEWESVKAKGD